MAVKRQLIKLYSFALGVGLILGASSAKADWKPLYRCVDLDEETPLESVMIYDGGGRFFASYRLLLEDGRMTEQKTLLTLSRIQGQDRNKDVYTGNGLTVEVDRLVPVSPGLYPAFISVRDLRIATFYAQCKELRP